LPEEKVQPGRPELVRQRTTLARFGELALRSSDLDEILTEACRVIGELLGTDLAAIMELQPGGEVLLMRAGVGWKPGVVNSVTVRLTEDTSETHALSTGGMMISPDISQETRFRCPPFLSDNGVNASVSVVIPGGHDKPPFGILRVDSRRVRQFTGDDTDFLRGYANLLAAALDRDQTGKVPEASVMERTRDLAEVPVPREEADQSNRVKSEFVAGISHDIRTSMNGVIGMTDLLLRTELSETQRSYANAIHLSADILLRLINTVRHSAKLESSRVELEEVDFRLGDCVDQEVLLLAPLAARKNLEFTASLDELSGRVLKGDPDRLRQVLRNLLSNAIKYTGQGSIALTISGTEAGQDRIALRIEVRDTGCGSSEAAGDGLFENFPPEEGPCGEEAISPRSGGNGLGLAVCKEIVTLMGGEIGVASEPGQGSLFWVRINLPLGIERAIPPKSLVNPLAGLRALIVDESEVDRIIFERHLVHHGMIVTTAENARSAVHLIDEAAAQGRPFNVVITDHEMRQTSGPEFARGVRRRLGERTPPMVLVSAVAMPRKSDPDRALFQACLARPLRGADLVECLIGVLSGFDPNRATGAAADPLSRGARPLGVPPNGARAHGAPPHGVPNGTRVLFVDDNAVNRMLGVTLLEEAGYIVETAEDGAQALEAVRGRDFAAVFMDVQMPTMDGIEATKAIRRLPPDKGAVPIIGLTAHAMVGDREAYLLAGMSDYLAKPLDTARFLWAAQRWTSPAKPQAQIETAGPPNEFAALPLLNEIALRRLQNLISRPKFQAIIQAYLDTDFLSGIEEAAAARDFPTLERMMHNCMGTAATLGASRLRAIAERLEAVSVGCDEAAVLRLLPDLRGVTELTHIALRDFASIGPGAFDAGQTA
jgi:two-component system sensor histidine kinase/response regulator